MRATILFVLFAATGPIVQAQSSAPTTKEVHVNNIATGEFVVKLQPLGMEELVDDSMMGRMSINKSISGDLVATTVRSRVPQVTSRSRRLKVFSAAGKERSSCSTRAQ